MIAPLAKFIDWSAIQAAALMMPANGTSPTRLEEALQFLKGPDFTPAESQPARMEFKGPLHFRFLTQRPCEFVENNVVHGRLYRCAEPWQKRPVIVLLHGGIEYLHYRFGYAWFARRCNRAGFNAVTLESPYHFQRRPRQYGPLSIVEQYTAVLCPDYLRVAETYAQAIAEIRSLVGWLLAEGCPAVALVGGSLGAYLAGLTVCCDPRLASVVMIMPPARQGNILSQLEHAVGCRARESVLSRRTACEDLDRTPLNLRTSQPAISREKVLLIEGMHDLMVSSGPGEIWKSWGQPEIWRLPHGHISTGTALIPSLTKRILRWLAPRLNAAAKNP